MVDNSDLEKYFLQILPEIFPSDECRALISLVAGDRSGVLLMSVQEEDEDVVETFCDDFNLSVRFMGERNDLFDPGAFITNDEERFKVLDDSHGKFYTCTDEAVGKFLGYPDNAVKYYAESDDDEVPGKDYQEKCLELYQEGELTEEDLQHLQLVDYVPRPEKENILDVVEKGKIKEKKLKAFDRENNTRVAEIYLQELFDRFDPEELT